MADALTLIIGVSALVGGGCGFAALVLVFMKRDCQAAVTVFGVCMAVCFAAMLVRQLF